MSRRQYKGWNKPAPGAKKVKHKFSAIAVEHDGIRFDSLKEGRYYLDLKLRQQSGEVLFFLRQVPLHLPGGTVMRIDFQEFHTDGTVHFIDVKGYPTESFKIKKREVEAIYPVTIETP